MTKFEGVLISAAKAFLFGGFGGLSIVMAAGIQGSDLKKIALVLLSAFVTSGFKAIEKQYNWNEQQ